MPCPKSGYLQHLDHGALVAAAREAGALVVLRFRPGQFVLRGEPLASVVPVRPSAPGWLGRRSIVASRSAATARSRRTASSRSRRSSRSRSARCQAGGQRHVHRRRVRRLARRRAARARREPPLEGNWYDTGELRVWIPAVRIERLVKLAFDQIRQASATTPAVLIRQLDVIRRVGPRMADAARRAPAEQAEAIRDTATALVALDRRDLDAGRHGAHCT